MVNKPLPREGSMCLTPQENAVACSLLISHFEDGESIGTLTNFGFWIGNLNRQNPKPKIQNHPYLFLLIRTRIAPDFTVQAAQHFAGLLGVEDDAVGREF
ncbi:hypothetical protein O77CONTIG1_03652 [Leptolyngbya sp. O-77]|nr:hypothetical protein O77CONTIG1_03652 [Leptolyngbya sp. O-77]